MFGPDRCPAGTLDRHDTGLETSKSPVSPQSALMNALCWSTCNRPSNRAAVSRYSILP